MPNYTTSYPTKKRPRPRKGAPSHLPGARRRVQHRRGSQYLHHSQGLGASRRGGHGYGGNSRKPYAIIIVGCAFLLFAASVIWYVNRSVDITLNGEKTSVRISSTVEQLIADQQLDLKAGNLLAVDDSVLEKGGGTACTVTLDGKKLNAKSLAATKLEGGEELEIADGEDAYEDHDVEATEIKPAIKVEGSGAIGYVATWGQAGRSEVWTGHTSGKTADKGVVKQPVECVVEYASVSPDDRSTKYIALTFDEGPSSRTEDILAVLEEKGVSATFFLSGEAAAANPSAVKAIADSGNELGSNGYSDADLRELSGDDLRSELSRGFEAIEQAGGKKTSLLRPAYGQFSDEDWAQAMDMVSAVVSWNVDSGDWLLAGAQSVVDTVASSAKTGNIVLLTDNDATVDQTIEALLLLIDRLQENGYTIVTLSDLIATDEELAQAVRLDKAGLPKGASLPEIPEEDGSADA